MRTHARARRGTVVAALTIALLATMAGAAQADVVDLDMDGNLTFTDDPGDASTLTVDASPTAVTFTQAGDDPITETHADCSGDTTPTVTCTGNFANSLGVEMGNGNDSVTANGVLGARIAGEAGDDTITGSDTNGYAEFLSGGDGTDGINSRNVGPSLENNTPFLSGGDGFPGSVVSDYLFGGSGNDILTSGNGDDVANGDGESFFFLFAALGERSKAGTDGGEALNPGTDVVSTGAGNDFATGGRGGGDQVNLGEGDDFADSEGGDGPGDAYDGGPGIDTFSVFNEQATVVVAATGSDGVTPPDDFSLDLSTGAVDRTNNGPESDTAVNFEDGETFFGNDTLRGTPGSNVLSSGPGNDTVDPGAGADTVHLDFGTGGGRVASAGTDGNGVVFEPGNDTANVADGFGDRVFCGGGIDTVAADLFDEVSGDCENVSRTEVRAGNADVIPPTCTVSRVKRRYGRKAFLGGFPIRLACDEAVQELVIRLVAPFKKGLVTSRAGDLVLAEKTLTPGTATVATRIRPARKFRRLLRNKALRTRLTVEARDQYGNRSVERKTVRVKKAKKKKRKRRGRR